MASGMVDVNKYYETLKVQALNRNDKSVITWSKYKSDLEVTKSLVSMISKKIKHSVMVPLGTKALLSGKIVHTNEYLVNLGETWFVKRTAHQTLEICDRRIKYCNEMLEKLEKERELIINKTILPAEQEAFGSDERPEIIEYVSEQENEEWKKEHRKKEKKYRQQLAELRKAEKAPIETEEDLWKHLDELELQEELEDELNRLNAECNSEEDISGENSDSEPLSKQMNRNLDTSKEENLENESKKVSHVNEKRKVSFACDSNLSDDEPLLLKIKHSETEPIPINPDCKQINSPADIYHHHCRLINKMPLSVLKNKIDLNNKNNLEMSHYNDDGEDCDDEEVNSASCVHVKDITERNTLEINSTQKFIGTEIKKISKFKSYRKKKL